MGKIKFVCVVDTLYSLSLYLLYQTKENIENTLFFVGNVIPEPISSKLGNVCRIDYKVPNWWGIKNLLKAKYGLRKYRRVINHSIIYAQDHLAFSGLVIGQCDYTLLEDGPGIFTAYKSISFMNPSPIRGIRSTLKDFFIIRHNSSETLGRSNHCKSVLYTTPSDSDSELLVGKECILLDLKSLWENANSEKKRYIMDVFGINKEDYLMYKQSKVIVFSQPLSQDCHLNDEEIVDIYSPYINQYKDEGVIIKPHPRDNFDYKSRFPDVAIMNCKAPMQILSIMGLSFKKAITVCSSAVSSMNSDCEILWIGAGVNKKILAVYGDLQCPTIKQ